jgi:predicted O-methyltransferase YrrM
VSAPASQRELWATIDAALAESLGADDDALSQALRTASAAGLPPIQVAALQGKFLGLLVRALPAKRVLEIGTLGGYSTIWIARGLPDGGRVLSLELEARHAEVARANLAAAGVGDRVEVVVGPALASLARMQDVEKFDLVFIDADKESTTEYFDWAVRHTRRGGVVIVDNVVRRGETFGLGEAVADDKAAGMRRFLDSVSADPRVEVTVVQTVGQKGHDGFAFAVVN